MMISSITNYDTNSQIKSLEPILDGAASPIRWLVITHNDPQLQRSLSAALFGQSVAMLSLSQDTWDTQSQELAETIEWAMQQSEIENLVIVGSSLTGGSQSRCSLLAPSTSDQLESGSSYARLLAGVERHHMQNQEARLRFAADFERIIQMPVVAGPRAAGQVAVHGLLYLAESGVFLTYDPHADRYQPLS